MGVEFLARVRRATLWSTGVASLMVATYQGPAQGLAVLLGAVWSLVNFHLLEKLSGALLGPDRGTPPALGRAALSVAGMMGLFAAGALLLMRFPPMWVLGGFLVPFGVIVLKAISLVILPTRFWRRLTSSPWRATLAVGAVVAGLWAATAGWSGPDAGSTPASQTRHGEAARAEDPHGTDPAHHGESGSEEHAAHGTGGPEKFPNVITILSRSFPNAPWAHFLHEYEVIFFAFLIAFLLCLVAYVATRRPQMVPGPLQNVVEAAVEALNDFVVGILGPKHGARYAPFLGSLFIYILVMNLFGLIPLMDSPTSSLNVTVALALVVFVYAQYIGLKELGLIGYVDHMAGNPRSLTSWLLVPLMLPIHLIGELAKPISLSARLFGNIFGEDMLLVAFATLGVTVLSFTGLPFGLPLHLPFIFLAILTSGLQALVFTVLSTIYFLLMLPHDEHEGEAAARAAHAH